MFFIPLLLLYQEEEDYERKKRMECKQIKLEKMKHFIYELTL